MAAAYEFEFDSFADSVAGHAAAKGHDPSAQWLGNLRGTGYVVTCDLVTAATMCRMKGGRVIRKP